MPGPNTVGAIDWYPSDHALHSLNGLNPTDSTHRQYHTTLTSWGRKFAEGSDLGMASAMTWATIQGNGSVAVDTKMIHRFISFVYEAVGEGENDATPSNYKAVKKAIPWLLNKQVTAMGHSTVMPRGYVNTIAGVKELDENITGMTSHRAMENREDLQADHDDTLTMDQWISIAEMLLSSVPVGSILEPPLGFSMCHTIFILGRALACRGEDIRGMVLGCLSVQMYPSIGPEGMNVTTAVSRKGKTNQSGRHTRQGFIAHANPILCPKFAMMNLLLYRWCVAHEPTPDWGNDMHGTLFVPLLRSMSSASTPLGYDKHHELCKAVLAHHGVAAGHSSHFTRGDTARQRLHHTWLLSAVLMDL
jgi:hypothetical protein